VQCWQQRWHNEGNDAIVITAKMPAHQQWHFTIVTRTTTPAWWWQWRHCNKGNNVIAMAAKTPGLQRRLCIDNGNTIAMIATTPVDNSKDACTLMTATTPLLQG
jgi:hypothetical protein